MLLFPFIFWLAAIVSLAMTVMLRSSGDLGPRGVALALIWFLVAGYCQFFAGSDLVAATGLGLQTLLAIGLIVRWRFTAP